MAHRQKPILATGADCAAASTKLARPRLDPLLDFDQLPNSAHVRIDVVQGLYACSRATVWRHVKAGHIPAPVKISTRITAWQVGSLRKHLMEMT